LKNLFNLFNQNKSHFSYSEIAVDFHSHLIPNVDDGSKSIEETLEILHFFKNLGYKKIITTPHIMSDGFDNNIKGLKENYEKIKEQCEAIIPFELAAEYFIDESFEKLIEQDDILHFGDKYVLIETSMNYEFPIFKECIFKLLNKGYNPILAHPERYSFIYNERNPKKIYESLSDLGIFFQLNMFSLLGIYNEKVKKTAEMLIDNNLIDFVSSDIHSSKQLHHFEEISKNKFLQKLIDSQILENKNLI
jgi:tyrosine-protein phosphatase YwqE